MLSFLTDYIWHSCAKLYANCTLAWLLAWAEVLDMAQLNELMPLIVFCFSKIKIGFTFLVPAHPGVCVPKTSTF